MIHGALHNAPPLSLRCVPSVFSPEAGLIAAQGALLVSRTLLTDYISRIEARAGRQLIQQVAYMYTYIVAHIYSSIYTYI